MRNFNRVLAYFRPYLPRLLVGAIAMMLFAQTDALIAIFVQPMFDNIFVDKDATFLWLIPIFSLSMILFKGVFSYAYGYFLGYTNTRVTIAIRNDLYERYLRASLSFFDHSASGELMSRLQYDAFNMQDSVNITMQLVQRSITTLGLIAVIFYRDWRMAILGLVLIPLVGVPVVWLGRAVKKLSTIVMDSMAEVNIQMFETLSGIKVVKAFGIEKIREEEFARHNENFFKAALRGLAVNIMTHPVIETIITLGVSAVLLYGGYAIVKGEMTPGTLFSFITAIGLVYDPVRNLSKANNQLQVALASAERVFNSIDSMPETQEKPDAKPLPEFKDKIVFKDVFFSYRSAEGMPLEQILCGINIEVSKGKTLAIVGQSGSGKTTLVNLIPRFYDSTSGSIQIDGLDICDTQLKSLREQIAVVTQETYLFNDTIANNIAYGIHHEVEQAEIENAARAAFAHDFIMNFPEKYETSAGQMGARLSGGQRQRIAIARALLKNSPILILDEATSSLDTESEQMVQKAIEALMKDRTTFVIAHRLSTVRRADEIVVLEKGKIVERGPHDELLAKNGVYKRLYELQFAAEDHDLLSRNR